MPLLKREVDFFPVGLFALDDPDRPWWVAHTRSRQEKAQARHLLRLATPFYVPQYEKTLRRGERQRRSFLPLFPGYVFFRGTLAQRQAAFQSRLVVQILEVQDQRQLQKELSELHALQQSGATLIPMEELHVGDAVQVTDGPFQGYSGVVVRGQARLRLLVSITMLRKTVAVEFDREIVRSLPKARRPAGISRAAVA